MTSDPNRGQGAWWTTRPVPRRTVMAGIVAASAAAALPLGAGSAAAGTVTSQDASVTYDAAAGTWTLRTATLERVLRFSAGTFQQTSLLNRATGRQFQQSGVSAEFRVRAGGVDHRGSSGGWTLVGQTTGRRADGVLVLTIDLQNAVLGVRRTYLLYPGTAFVEDRTHVTNRTAGPLEVTDCSAVSMRVLGGDASRVQLYTMTGDKASTSPWHQLQGPFSMASGLRNPGGRGGNGHAEFLTLRDPDTGDGIVVTWDYTGNWVLNVGDSYGKILVEPRTTTATALAPGATIHGPLGRIGLYRGDIDDMGNALLGFTYRYLWEHTHDAYFPMIRYGGYGSDRTTIVQKIEQLAYLGGDMVWIDDGWQDAVGDWNDRPDEPLAEYRAHAARHGQHLGLWLVPWGAEAGSAVAAAHPGWMVDPTDRKAGLDIRRPDVVAHIRQVVNARQAEFGPFQLKTDFGADSGDPVKAHATMQVLRTFVEDNPDASLQLCSDGGGLLTMGTAALSDLVLQQDGPASRAEGYWSSLLYPTEKLICSYGRSNIGAPYQPANRHLLSFHLTVAGDTTAGPAALEPLRKDADLYRYLRARGVLGRGVRVYRPTVDAGQDPTGILLKLSEDGVRGYITFPMGAFAAGASVVVVPKGLTPDRSYTVSSQEGTVARATRTGAEWTSQGFAITGYRDGEVIYLNLEDRPGAGYDRTPPGAPSSATAAPARRVGFDGVELSWAPGTDDTWVSYVELLKNGAPFWKVSRGDYYFDRAGTTSDTYDLRTVDGDGNASSLVRALWA